MLGETDWCRTDGRMRLRGVFTSVTMVLAAGVLAGTVAVAPAEAVVNRSYSFDTAHDGGVPGWTHVEGDLTWYNKRKFALSGVVDDHCPVDGAWAQFKIQIFYKRGDLTRHTIKADRGGCRGAGNTFSRVFDRERRIRFVALIAYERSDNVIYDAASRLKWNPYVDG